MREARHAAKLGTTGAIRRRRKRQRERLIDTLTSSAAIQRPAPPGSTCTSCGGTIAEGEPAIFTTPPPGDRRAWIVAHARDCSTPTVG